MRIVRGLWFLGLAIVGDGFVSLTGGAWAHAQGIGSRSEAVHRERLAKLDRYERELEGLLQRVRRSQVVTFREVRDLESRYEMFLLDAVDMELADVYRLENLLKRAGRRTRKPEVGMMPKTRGSGQALAKAQTTELTGTEGRDPNPEPDRDRILDLTPMLTPPARTDFSKLGDSYFSLGNYRQALRAYDRYESKKESGRILYQIALCYERLEQFPSAHRAYEEVKNRFGDTYWGKQSVWALDYVSWKQELSGLDRELKKKKENEKENGGGDE